MESEVREALITGATIAAAVTVTIPIGLNIYDQGIKPMLENEKKRKQKIAPANDR